MFHRARIVTLLQERGAGFAADLIVNVVLPTAIYFWLSPRMGDVRALLWSSAPPVLWSVIEFLRARRIDAISMLVLAGIALSVLAVIGGGGARWLQLREKLVTAVIGLAFLVSAMIGRPLTYVLARAASRRKPGEDPEGIEELAGDAGFRRMMNVITIVWGLGLLADVFVSVILVFVLPIGAYLIVNPILGYGFVGALVLWTYWYSRGSGRSGRATRGA
jgi:hypothetical protein